MPSPKWLKSIAALLPTTDRILSLPKLAVGTALAAFTAQPATGQGVPASRDDIVSPIDSGFTRKNEKFILTRADSFVVNVKGEITRFRRTFATPPTLISPVRPRSGHASHASHSSHSSHSSHRSHGSGGWL